MEYKTWKVERAEAVWLRPLEVVFIGVWGKNIFNHEPDLDKLTSPPPPKKSLPKIFVTEDWCGYKDYNAPGFRPKRKAPTSQ